MSRYLKITLVLAVFLCFFLIVIQIAGAEILVALGVAAIVSFLLFISFLVISIVEKLRKHFSPYRIFAIVNICLGVCVSAYAVYDIKTDVGLFAGLLGAVLLAFVIPVIVLLLIADFIVWICKR